MTRRRDEVTVGILITFAVTVLIIGSIWLARGGLASGYPLYTRFNWGQNLKNGQAVKLAGVDVGYIDGVKLGNGYLDVTLAITDKDFKIPKGTVATVIPVGIFGDVAVALTPPKPLPTVAFQPGDTIPAGPPPPDIGALMGRVDSIGGSLQRISAALEKEYVESGGFRDLRRVTAQMATLGGQLSTIMAQQNANLLAAGESFRSTAQKFAGMTNVIDSAKVDSVMKNFQSASANLARVGFVFDSTSRKIQAIVDSVEKGKGSVGRLLMDPTVALRIEGIMATLDSLVVDIKRNPQKYLPPVKLCC